MFITRLTCMDCGWCTLSGAADLVERFRSVGMLRRETEPSEELIEALLPTAAARMNCPNCGVTGLDAQQEDVHALWHDAVLCRICRQPISAERLGAVPDTHCCARCQADAEAGRNVEEPEYCPVCGSPMELRPSSNGGITRYKLYCTATPACRR